MKKFSYKIRILGDWAPENKAVIALLNIESIIINIEGPILGGDSKILKKQKKAGPLMFSRAIPMPAQQSIAILANNHLMDFGSCGLVETINALEQQGKYQMWRFVGAGFTKNQAIRPLIIENDGVQIGVLSRCETQFGIASTTKPGVAAFDSTIYQQISDLKKQVDFVIVSIHAAAEMVPWPSPQRQETWRSLIDAGADVVHGHHAHVPQGWEEYKGGFIFYGLGNFCVDPQKWSWHPQGLWSLTPEIELTENGIKIKISTTVVDEFGDAIRIREASDAEHSKHIAYLDQCNRPLSDPILLEGLMQEASIRMYNDHFSKWLGFDSPSLLKIFSRHLRSKLGAIKRRLQGDGSQSAQSATKGQLLLRYHLFACESHNEAIGTALGVLGGELEDRRSEETAILANELMVLR
jgi:hypothetical protein